jgi:hypothetical protein
MGGATAVIPRGSKALGDIAMKLVTSIAPETNSAFAAANVGLMTMLLGCLAQDYERAAENRALDVREMKALFASATGVPAELAADLAAFGASEPESLRLSHLDAWHARALTLLIRLHEHAEGAADATLDRSIWEFLQRHVARHAFAAPGI